MKINTNTLKKIGVVSGLIAGGLSMISSLISDKSNSQTQEELISKKVEEALNKTSKD